jgi:D-alanyl-D-alanine endopeptidase (penicillin-binding protein 7)
VDQGRQWAFAPGRGLRDHCAMNKNLPALLLISMGLLGTQGPVAASEPGSQQRVLRVWEQLDTKKLRLRSKGVLVADEFGNRLYEKQADTPRPIASLTKLMSAMVVLDSPQSLDEKIRITKADRDLIKLTGSRLRYGATLSRGEILSLALMSSDNRAAAALARTYTGGTAAFVKAMNTKAKALHMHDSRFVDPAGLNPENVASPADLARMISASARYPLIRKITTRRMQDVRPYKRKGPLRYVNTNRLLRNERWEIHVGKTGYINEAGRCLAMLVNIDNTDMVMVFLDSYGKLTPFGDANRTRKWLQKGVRKRSDLLAQADIDGPASSVE